MDLSVLYRITADAGAAKPVGVETAPISTLQSAGMFENDEVRALLFALLVVGVVFYYVWLRADFVVRVRDGRCRYAGKLPLVMQKALTQFLLDEIQPRRPLTIRGNYHAGRLRLRFWGDVTAGEKQRIRNFLLSRR
jgi:hypothetical protein